MQMPIPRYAVVEGDRRLAYDECSPVHPEGTVLLLIGLGAKRLAWWKQLPSFGQHFRTLAVDYRDIGDSDPYLGPYGLADQARDLDAFLEAVGAPKAHVVAISMGGFVAQELALRYPERVQSLVLTATSRGGASHVYPPREVLNILFQREKLEPGVLAQKMYQAMVYPGHFERFPQDWERVAEIARYKPVRADSYQRQLQSAIPADTTSRISTVQVPTLVIHGDQDPLVPLINGQRLAESILGAQLVLFEDCGHIPPLEQPDRYNAEVLRFLRAVKG